MRYNTNKPSLTREELALTMADYVETNMKHYKGDFYEYDINTLTEMKEGDARFWILRETGTFFPVTNYCADTTVILNHCKTDHIYLFVVLCVDSKDGNSEFIFADLTDNYDNILKEHNDHERGL